MRAELAAHDMFPSQHVPLAHLQNDIARGSLYNGTAHDEPGRPSPGKKKGGGGGLFSACCGG